MVTKGGCQGWLQQRTNLEKTLLSLSCLLILTLILLVLVGMAFKGKNSEVTKIQEKPGCWSTDCIKTAGQILSLMDERWDPCSNFYDYACGSFSQASGQSVAQNSIDQVYFSIKDLLESSSSTDEENLDSLKSFYSNCMEFDGMHTKRGDTSRAFLEIMERFGIGGWPVLDGYYETTLTQPERLTALTLVGVPVAFRIEVVPDAKIQGSYLLKISPGGPLESGRSAIDIRSDQDLRTYMLFSFLLLGTSTYTKSTHAVDDILSVDAYYANVEQDTVRNCDTLDMLSPDESLSKLNNMIPEMNWTVLVTTIQKEAGLKRPFAVEVHCKAKIRDYLIHLNDIVDGISQNYFGWCFFEAFAKHVEPSLRKSQSNGKGDVPRWKECVKLIEKNAAPSLAQGLTQQRIKKGTGEKVEEIVANFQTAAEQLVSNSRWLSRDKKTKILRQIKDMKLRLPYARINTTSSSRNLQLPEVSKDDFTAAVIELRRQRVIQSFRKLNPSLETDGMSELWEPLLTSASYIPSESALPIYFDKIQEPYLRLRGSKWLNYGGFSTSLAREWSEILISEGVGISVGDHTSIWDLWSSNRNASSCLMNLFSERFGLNSEIGREKLLKDLFLDISSLEIALQIVKSGTKSQKSDLLPGLERDDEQMFFIAYAQTLCESKRSEGDSKYIPIRDRVNTVVSNSRAFEEAFTCSVPARSLKCNVWT